MTRHTDRVIALASCWADVASREGIVRQFIYAGSRYHKDEAVVRQYPRAFRPERANEWIADE